MKSVVRERERENRKAGGREGLRRLGLFEILLLLVTACGRPAEAEAPTSAAPATSAPGDAAPTSVESGAEPEPTTLAEAERLLEQARADLDRLALNEPNAAPPAAAGAAAPAPSPAAESRRDRAEKSAADEAEAPAPAPPPPAKQASPCQTACRAFASLERASDAVCRLDAEGGQRCVRARQIREDAARRVASCACAG